jgi:glycosyltransferase involved in cell wall biosynthesis
VIPARPRPIHESTFAIVANGFAEGPAQALRDYLVGAEARSVTTIFHPLLREGDTRHMIETRESGKDPVTRRVRLPFRPPYTYPLDLVVPRRAPAVDGWFGFNSLAAARGLVARGRHRADTIVYWCVDFVPERFGRGPLTGAYDALDRLCSARADARFELSQAALKGRNDRHGIPADELAPTRVVPMGAWLKRVPTTEPEGHQARRVVFLGHLVPRQGVGLLLEALAQVDDVEGDIIGRGPLEEELRREASHLGLDDRLHFHGFVEDYREVERLLARASIAVAPYEPTQDSFSRYADPGKLKGYLGAGLPILLTDVPPNAQDLVRRGGAEIVPFSADALAQATRMLLDTPEEWKRRRALALALAREFDWPRILEPALESVGFTP